MSETTHTHAHEEIEAVTVCYRHPDVETSLRCNRCGKPICTKCAELTPVGYRCPDCVRQQQDKFYTGGNLDYVIAVLVARGRFSRTKGLSCDGQRFPRDPLR